MKNLKYETRDLTLWEGKGSETRVATIQHLKDLRHRCEKAGLDTGINALDLVLIYFFDQNSDACERIFTQRIADLLDEHVPGSQGTSIFIRAVTHLVEPFRNPGFGSPADIQRSVSCAITVFRLWKKVLELKKIRLHSQPSAKSNPSKRGHFLTHGCYTTAEIQFTAASIHQLAMFLHFKELGPEWASPYRSGTKVTERIISEMQGKTNEIQSLDSQPSFADMLQKSSSVQFNLNAKVRLAKAGIQVKTSAKRKRAAFAFKKHKDVISGSYSYPDSFPVFIEQQRQAHFAGKKEGQLLFSRYMPAACVQLLKDSDVWETPYTFVHPSAIQLVNGPLPDDYNKLNVSFADKRPDECMDIEDQILEGVDDDECVKSKDLPTQDEDEILGKDEVVDDMDKPEPAEKGKSGTFQGNLTMAQYPTFTLGRPLNCCYPENTLQEADKRGTGLRSIYLGRLQLTRSTT